MPTQTNPLQGYSGPDLVDFAANDNAIRVAATTEIVNNSGELANVVLEDSYEWPVEDGRIIFGHYEGNGPAYTTQEIQKVSGNAVDSNQSIIKRSTIKQPYNTSVDSQTGKVSVSGTPKSGSFAQNAAYFLTEVNQAVLATQVGIALGKGFDSILYNANPDFWDSHGMSSLNPETWAGITAGDTSFGATLFNMIFGIDPATGNGQAYVDADAFAYLAQYLNTLGVFSGGGLVLDQPTFPSNAPTTVTSVFPPEQFLDYFYNEWKAYADAMGVPIHFYNGSNTFTLEQIREKLAQYPTKVGKIDYYSPPPSSISVSGVAGVIRVYDINIGQSLSYGSSLLNSGSSLLRVQINVNTYSNEIVMSFRTGQGNINDAFENYFKSTIHETMGYKTKFTNVNSTITSQSPIDGITNQTGATNPDTSTWTSPQATDASLRQQYPDMYTNAIKYDVPDASGNLVEKTYIPVSWPNTASNPWTDLQPTSDTSVQTQTSTMVDMLTGIQSMIDTLTTTLTQPVNTSQTGNLPPAENPTDTGSGSSPVPVIPTGSSSKLWSVYHPTQAQVDAFGSWLWSTSFVDQLLKMFQNPMEGIISLHKVFATPIDAGTGNIIVGTLDSGVASATVTQQYVYVSCGSVDCHEDFGNVFDYSPHTQVSLYLPFIGIVPLDVSDVMRSTITVDYGVDMFTGACLAMVKVSRDNDTVNMYQYAGSASVEYPLSNVQQSQLLSGILAVAAGGAAIATGGMSIPAGAAVAGGLANTMKSNVGHSGGFSGNAGAMGIKKPYLILQRPQTKVAELFPVLAGYPTNISGQLSDFSGQVKVTDVHVEGIPATDVELTQIEELLHSGVLV